MKPPVVPSLVFAVVAAAVGVCVWNGGLRAQMRTGATAAFTMVPGVVVDPGSCVVYMMNRNHGIDAVRVASGTLLWSTTRAAQPLAVAGIRLAAQEEPQGDAHTLKIAVLDTRDGAVLHRAAVPLPDPARASIDQGAGSSFALQARVRGGAVDVSWRFSSRRAGGIAMRNDTVDDHQLHGAVLVDLSTGQAAPAASSESSRPRPRAAGISADGRFVIVSHAGGADSQGLPSYTWEIRSIDSGRVAGRIASPTSMAPFFICRGMLVYEAPRVQRRTAGKLFEQPLELRAFDLNTQAPVWTRPLRDTTFRGPGPPAS